MTLVYWSYWIQKNVASAQGHEVSFCMFYTSSPLTKHIFSAVCCFVGKTCSCFLKPFRFKIVLAPVWLQNKLALSSCYLSCWGHAHGIIWKPWDFYIRKQKILADSLRFFHKTLDLKEKCNQTKERKKSYCSNYENWRKLRRKLKLFKLHCTGSSGVIWKVRRGYVHDCKGHFSAILHSSTIWIEGKKFKLCSDLVTFKQKSP